MGDFTGLKKGIGELGKFLALLQGLLRHLQVFLGLDQTVKGLAHRKGHFVGGPLDFLFLRLGAGLGGLGIVIGLQAVED